ncbi:MAG TPA: hypothetical protein VEA80_19885 [Vitreimonas sp.]|uniref:hypothetical protein n=1 Tax=Vitreimonas sp. TaxID=3069702 RepID=UPI002D44C22D|nr:hypothetical protein [Vitreimonas sp.]HYD89752.1 hypothetical protein [Vitreimonas sp.]
MEPVIYRRRAGAISRGEREWRVEEDALVSRGASGRERRYLWSEMMSVRLCHEPGRFRPWRYVFELQPKHARKIEIDNAHFLGPRSFEQRSESYAAFVRAALTQLQAARPGMRVLIGETPKRYFFLLLAALLAFGALAYALIAIPTPFDDLAFVPLVKLVIILAMLPMLWLWVLGSLPRGVPLDDIPPRALPPAAEEAGAQP